MGNLDLWEKVCHVPQEYLSPYKKGNETLTQIDPVWRLQMLTEQFGPCGVGWWYEITGQWIEKISTTDARAFCNINLYYKTENGESSHAIPGTGGFRFVYQSNDGVSSYGNDEAYKAALTDAISVAAKALGIGADVYMNIQSHLTMEEEPACETTPKNDEFVSSVDCQITVEKQNNHPADADCLREEQGSDMNPEAKATVSRPNRPAGFKQVSFSDTEMSAPATGAQAVEPCLDVPASFEECLNFRFADGEFSGKTAGEIFNTNPDWFVKKDEGFKKRRTDISRVSPAVAAQMRVIMMCADAVRTSAYLNKAS